MAQTRQQPPLTPVQSENPHSFISGCYFPSWCVHDGMTPSSMDLNVITHIFYAFASVSPDGTVGLIDVEAHLTLPVDQSMGGVQACLALKQFHPVKVLISIGGGDDSGTLLRAASRPETRVRLGISMRKFVEHFGFDGIDVDCEHIDNPQAAQKYILLLRSLREHLPHHQLTSALPAQEWCLRNIDLLEAIQYLDFINLMCYDFAGPWTELSGHHAQLYAPSIHSSQSSGDSAVRYLLAKGVPASKIVMGIPAFGRSFSGTNDINQKSSGHGEFQYKNLAPVDVRECVDRDLAVAYCVSQQHGFITYDNIDTVAVKAQYVKQHRLAGLFYWTGIADAPSEPRNLMRTGYKVLAMEHDVESILEAKSTGLATNSG